MEVFRSSSDIHLFLRVVSPRLVVLLARAMLSEFYSFLVVFVGLIGFGVVAKRGLGCDVWIV
jgi:hypothetical protein